MEGRDVLKALAQQAKDRLTGKIDKKSQINSGKMYISNSEAKIVTISNTDDKFNSKVKEIIENNTFCPLNELIDFSYYNTLSNEQKERYFFTLAERFRNSKQKLVQEKLKQVN